MPRGCIRLHIGKDDYRCGPMEITNILKMLPLFSLLFCHSVAWFPRTHFIGNENLQSKGRTCPDPLHSPAGVDSDRLTLVSSVRFELAFPRSPSLKCCLNLLRFGAVTG